MKNNMEQKTRKKRNSIVTPEIKELQEKLSQARKEAREKAEENFYTGMKRKINLKYIELNKNPDMNKEQKTAQFKEFLKTLLN